VLPQVLWPAGFQAGVQLLDPTFDRLESTGWRFSHGAVPWARGGLQPRESRREAWWWFWSIQV
jgi:hypothetical protein